MSDHLSRVEYCLDCPDHGACSNGMPCTYVKLANERKDSSMEPTSQNNLNCADGTCRNPWCATCMEVEAEQKRNYNLTEVIDKRQEVYGDPVLTFPRAAQIWSGILGVEVTAADVALCLIGYKTLRTQMTPDYSDNSDDIEGYLDIFRSIVGEDMVHARSVTEYVEKKQ